MSDLPITLEGPEPSLPHILRTESTGRAPWDEARIRCSCGWCGPWRAEASDFQAVDLANDELRHVKGNTL